MCHLILLLFLFLSWLAHLVCLPSIKSIGIFASCYLSALPDSIQSKSMTRNQDGEGGSKAFRGPAFLSTRRARVVSMDQGQEQDLDLFQSHVADHLLALLPPPSAAGGGGDSYHQQFPLLSLAFLSKLLDAFLSCEEEFRSLILGCNHASLLSKPPADRAVDDLLDRAVKSLDICNAASFALDSLRHWHRQGVVATSALLPGHRGEGPLNRSRRALAKLLASSPGEGSGSSGRSGSSQMRSIMRSVPRSWSSSRNMPPVPAHLATPRGGEAGGAGMALAVYAMSSVLSLTMWALAAAFRSHDRSASAPSSPVSPRQHLCWAQAMAALQDSILEEWRMRKGSAGLLAEVQALERCGKGLMEAVGEAGPSPSRAEDVAAKAAELAEACERLEEGLGPLERQVREVFHRVIGSRAEVIRCVDQSTRAAAGPTNASVVSS
ncbi:hypothetical protein Cni_G28060 [Canna indica]|uniref:Uncharacterized protein n=1 Tax=Canna indica TaxID=4628 RepID=A0AAQ3L8W1_9LILI|nr:hypothetical protein Cni_G28060 [Canna indica]